MRCLFRRIYLYHPLEQPVFHVYPVQEYRPLPQFIDRIISLYKFLQSTAHLCLRKTIKNKNILEKQINLLTFPISVYFFAVGFRQNQGNFFCLIKSWIPLKAVFHIYILLLVDLVLNLGLSLCCFSRESRFKRD